MQLRPSEGCGSRLIGLGPSVAAVNESDRVASRVCGGQSNRSPSRFSIPSHPANESCGQQRACVVVFKVAVIGRHGGSQVPRELAVLGFFEVEEKSGGKMKPEPDPFQFLVSPNPISTRTSFSSLGLGLGSSPLGQTQPS
ncbi:hypothetical protein CRG98_035944 [Punica granatum]|uniref:Uncharacterized protein n=1 Tax=Punica granatum TaxID=22663 RepID=A0A2I0II54_PUNGR|nr:hypothetical protein CRG98_035944 [Punica granatum]